MPLKFWPFKRRQQEVELRPSLVLSEDEKSNLKGVGYWRSEPFPDITDHSTLPHPKDFVDPQWDVEERQKVIRYLDDGYMRYMCMGPSWCRMGCENVWMGTCDFTDGTWMYPEGYVHYLDVHGVRPPEEFLVHIRKNDYKMPVFSEDRLHRPQYVKPPPNTLREFSKAFLYALIKIAGVILVLLVFGYLLFSFLALFN
jgi:hypothetical protein